MTIDIDQRLKRVQRNVRWIWFGMFGWALAAAAAAYAAFSFLETITAHQARIDDLALTVRDMQKQELAIAATSLSVAKRVTRHHTDTKESFEQIRAKIVQVQDKVWLSLTRLNELMRNVARNENKLAEFRHRVQGSLRFEDKQGKVRIELYAYKAGATGLRLTDQNGKVRALLGMDVDGTPFLILLDKNGQPRAVLGVATTGASITGTLAKTPEGALTIFDAEGKSIWMSPR